jgi:hypothetical protein
MFKIIPLLLALLFTGISASAAGETGRANSGVAVTSCPVSQSSGKLSLDGSPEPRTLALVTVVGMFFVLKRRRRPVTDRTIKAKQYLQDLMRGVSAAE